MLNQKTWCLECGCEFETSKQKGNFCSEECIKDYDKRCPQPSPEVEAFIEESEAFLDRILLEGN